MHRRNNWLPIKRYYEPLIFGEKQTNKEEKTRQKRQQIKEN